MFIREDPKWSFGSGFSFKVFFKANYVIEFSKQFEALVWWSDKIRDVFAYNRLYVFVEIFAFIFFVKAIKQCVHFGDFSYVFYSFLDIISFNQMVCLSVHVANMFFIDYELCLNFAGGAEAAKERTMMQKCNFWWWLCGSYCVLYNFHRIGCDVFIYVYFDSKSQAYYVCICSRFMLNHLCVSFFWSERLV